MRKNTKPIERYFRKQIIPAIGNQKIADVTPQQVLAITDGLKGFGSPMAALEVRNLLKRFFAYAATSKLRRSSTIYLLGDSAQELARLVGRRIGELPKTQVSLLSWRRVLAGVGKEGNCR